MEILVVRIVLNFLVFTMPKSGYKDSSVTVSTSGKAASQGGDGVLEVRPQIKKFIWFVVVLLACFSKPLFDLARLGFANDLYSHVFLIPAVSIYLVWIDRAKLPTNFRRSPGLIITLFSMAILLMTVYGTMVLNDWQLTSTDRLSLFISTFLLCLSSGVVWCFGTAVTRAIVFPLCFLIFMVPMPAAMAHGILTFLQHGSAEISYWMLKLTGMTIFRDGTVFRMPGVAIRVAEECSGIRSSLVLFISSVVAAHLLLQRGGSKIVLVLAVIPLGIFRNALRIFVLATLAVYVDRDILDSALHHKGGPVFFLVSLVPFFLLIWFLRKRELKRGKECR